MPMTWNADTDAKLMAAILATSDVKVNYAAVATLMGPECTAKAITHRVGAIKAKAKDVGLASPSASPSGTPPTSRKRGRPSTKAQTSNGGGEDDGGESPTKKTKADASKTKRKAPAAPVKAETKEEQEVKMDPGDEGEEDA
ncbi:hypothetical protein PV11_06980 [Exophiala sideris]|uniref:AT hook motif protein n=1 Tax=Exophiala sideris TaxID=1016849 RepID=A0A0D1YXA6_9EURO|nr:hypothetical protein PV11_06980 [Exophiala sideris]